MEVKHAKWIKRIGVILFLFYIIALFYFMFFSEKYGRTIEEREYSYNLVLFKEIGRFIKYRHTLGNVAVFTNLVGNVAAFVPFGFILPVINKKRRSFFLISLLTFELSLLIELTQLVLKVGIFDVDDLFMNTIGGMVGYLVFWIANQYRRKHYG